MLHSSSSSLLLSSDSAVDRTRAQESVATVAMVLAALFLAMVMGTLLIWCANRGCVRAQEQLSPPPQTLELRPRGRDDVIKGSVVLDLYTTTSSNHTNTRSPSRKTRTTKESFLSVLTEEPVRSWSFGDEEETIPVYGISRMDVGSLLLPSNGNVEQQQQQQEQHQQPQQHLSATMSASFPSAQSCSTTTLPLVVQRTLKAPPGKLGLTLAISSEGPKVRSIQEGSPIEGMLFVGDIIVDINDIDTRSLSIPAIFSLLKHANDLPHRSITVLTMDDTTRNGQFLC